MNYSFPYYELKVNTVVAAVEWGIVLSGDVVINGWSTIH
jgi:hypothetical protein